MNEDISRLIESQIPEHLREGSPLFAAFVSTYYEYASQQNKALGLIQNSPKDIDICDDAYIDRFYESYGQYLPVNVTLDKRNLLKLLHLIYSSKGTEKSLVLIFKLIFGEDVMVTYPREQILRASDGDWVKDSFITIKKTLGTNPQAGTFLSFTNSQGDFSFEIDRTQVISADLLRVFYKSHNSLIFKPNQIILQADNFGVVQYQGDLQKSPSRLDIIDGGNSWVVGQAIVVPGTLTNTIARVTGVDSNGGVTSLEILEYGYDHYNGQVTTVSAFDVLPVNSTTVATKTMVSFDPLVYHHDLSIIDNVMSIDETITGTHDCSIFGDETFEQVNIASLPDKNSDYFGLTQEMWLSSRVVLSFVYTDVVNTKGYYKTVAGQLSNQNIVTQDNYFYQAYSYLMETARDVREYESILKLTHPAGTKRFSKLAKVANYMLEFDYSRTLSIDTLYLHDIYDAIEELLNHAYKVFAHSVTMPDSHVSHVYKVLADLATVNEDIIKHFYKVWNDTLSTPTDTDTKHAYKVLSDVFSNTDGQYTFATQKVLTELSTITEALNNSYNKNVIPDSFGVQHSETYDYIMDTYAAEDYYSEAYVSNAFTLTIGL